MKLHLGERIVVRSRTITSTERHGEVVEVRGDGPPYVVQWDSDGHTSLFFPGPDMAVEVLAGRSR